jgi:hypothetical protein
MAAAHGGAAVTQPRGLVLVAAPQVSAPSQNRPSSQSASLVQAITLQWP